MRRRSRLGARSTAPRCTEPGARASSERTRRSLAMLRVAGRLTSRSTFPIVTMRPGDPGQGCRVTRAPTWKSHVGAFCVSEPAMGLLSQATDYTDKDFDSLRLRLQSLARSAFPTWTDFNIANFGNL